MIAKILFEFIFPFCFLGLIVWGLLKGWFFNFLGKSIENHNKIDKQAKKYDKKLKKG